MRRREFVKAGFAVGAGTLVSGCNPSTVNRSSEGKQGPASGGPGWNIPDFAHAEATVADLQRAQAAGTLTARSLAEAYLARMDAIDKAGPRLGSVIERNPDALAIADRLDRERKERGPLGPLHGIPILIKDNIATADRMETTAGSWALVGSKPQQDATLVARLRAAGAVILGKTNLSEWANFRSTRSTSGWSGRGGQTKNPYALDRNPCGSSSGSGVATSANLCAAAIGTETDGSIVCPASICGIVGIKPTVGLASRTGIIPISVTQDTAGPMARTVADAAVLLTVIAGMDGQDPATSRGGRSESLDYTSFLNLNALKGARLGVARKLFGRNPRVAKAMENAVAALKKLGAEIIDPVEMQSPEKLEEAEWEVLLYEFKAELNKYLAMLGPAATQKTLADLIAFNEANRDREMPYFGQEIFLQAQEKGPLTEKKYRQALETCRRASTVEGIDGMIQRHKLDALIAPTTDPAYPTDLINGDHFTGGGSTVLPAVAGYPHITVPAGQVFGLPIGVSFIGRAWSEPRLIALAYAFEQATKCRQAPRFLRTADLSE
jgi:amidase